VGKDPEVLEEGHQGIATYGKSGDHIARVFGQKEIGVHHGEKVEEDPHPSHAAEPMHKVSDQDGLRGKKGGMHVVQRPHAPLPSDEPAKGKGEEEPGEGHGEKGVKGETGETGDGQS
jgi:hypothetical protein